MTSPERNQIALWIEELVRINQEVQRTLEPLSDAQFSWRPAEGKWSVAECLEHLAITTGLMLTTVRPAIDKGRAEGITGTPPFKFGLMGGWFVRMMEKPGKRPLPSPKNFVPPSSLVRSAVLGKFAAVQQELRDAIESTPGLALDKLKAKSAAAGGGWIRLNLAAWIASTLAHQRRHVAQALRVTQAPGFPA
jgi:hypothetical protein